MSIRDEDQQKQEREGARKKRILRNLLKDPTFREDSNLLQEMLNKVLNSLNQSLKDITKETEGLGKVVERLEIQLKSKRDSLAARDVFFEYFYQNFGNIESRFKETEAEIKRLEDVLLEHLNYPLYKKKHPDTRDIFG